VTDTDLNVITAGESTDANQQSDTVTTNNQDAPTTPSVDKGAGSLSTMVLPELRALANRAGVKGTSGMRKNELIAAIQETRGPSNGASTAKAPPAQNRQESSESAPAPSSDAPAVQGEQNDSANSGAEEQRRERRGASRDAGSSTRSDGDTPAEKNENRRGGRQDTKTDDRGSDGGADQSGDQQGSGGQQGRGSNQQDDDGEGRQGRRGRRFRDRRRRGERTGGEGGDTELRDDDVVQPVAGILDVLDNYAFVRTSGYLAGPHDVYVSMNMVRKNGLRRGDAVTGAVRVPKEGEQPNQRQKFNPLVRLDSVNGGSVEDAKKRPDFSKLTPLYPNQRLRLETTPDRLTTRVIDLIMPIGKGQRALIVSPPKAGKTTILQDIANAITKNNPECHLMVVLVDERPEEVTDMTRSVKGEVIASTFDRPPSDHTSVAELAIERAKRLVEQGKDVVVLLDSITRLGRAYNNASPASGRILSGGVDSTALYPPKRFLGAARNIEEGGSLTIIATAMVETGSTGDTVIFEEFKGTGNAELKLDRKISERRVFPAVDVNPSGTRKDELLLSPDEFGIVHKLRRVLSGLDSHQAIDLLMSQLRKTKTNYEFLVQVSKTTPGSMDND
jgi:transcription termination factor Rho